MNESFPDLLREAAASVKARRLRMILTSSGIALGVAAFLGATSVAEAAASSIKTRLEEVTVTTITLRLDLSSEISPVRVLRRAERNLAGLEDVTGVGASIDLTHVIRSVAVDPDLPLDANPVPVLGVSAGYAVAVDALPDGDGSDALAPAHPRPALVGRLVPDRMGREALPPGQTVFLAGRAFEVMATSSPDAVDPRIGESILVSLEAADELGWLNYGVDEATVVVRTEPGSAHELAGAARLLAWPEKAGLVNASVSADPRRLRSGIEGDTLVLVGGVSLLLLVLGIFSIANAMLADVMARISEIGLRRALGASRKVIGTLLLLESSAVGFAGGVAGTALGTGGAIAASVARDWPVTVVPLRLLLAPLGGAIVGGIAGLYPAIRAARIDPAATLRGL